MLRETLPTQDEISAFGKNVVKVIDSKGKTVCFIGEQKQQEMIHFPAPISLDLMPNLHEIWEKRKLMKEFLDAKQKKALAS